MADNVTANAGAGGATFATDDIAGVQYPRTKMTWGPDGTANDTDVASGKPLPIQIRSSTGTELATNAAPIQVADSGGSLTVDSAQLPGTLGQKTMANSVGVVIASDQSAVPISAASLPLPTGAATAAKQPALGTAGTASADVLTVQGIASMTALKVDGSAVTQPVSAASLPLPTGAATETTLAALNTKTPTAKTSDYDTGAGTDTVPMVGIALPASGGAVQGGTATNPVRMDPTGTTTQPVSDAGGSLTVDSAQLPSSLGQKTMANSMGVVIASDQSNLPVAGPAAHDAAISGNPVRIAGRAGSADYTAVASGDVADLLTDLNGKIVTMPYAIPENTVSGATAAITGTTDTAVIAAQGAGIRIYVTHILVTNSHATVGTVVEIKDGTTVLYRGYAAPAGGGFSVTLPKPLRLTANTALNAANITTGSNTYVSASGYKAP